MLLLSFIFLLHNMVDDNETPKTEPSVTDESESWTETIEDTKQQLAEAYLNFLDKQKWGILATGAWMGVNLNPLQKEALEYLTTETTGKDKKDIFATIRKNIKKKSIEQISGWTMLAYDKASLTKMKALIIQNKNDQAKLQELMAQIQAGTDPTLATSTETATTTPNSVTNTAAATVVWAWAVETEASFEETEIKRGDYVYPVPNAKINSPVGMRTIEGMGSHMHKGVDIAAAEDTPILSIADATIESVGFGGTAGFSWYGNYMQVKLKNWYRVLYGHMSKPAQKADGTEWKTWDIIKKSEQVGLMGSTWSSTGSHLHLEIRKGKFENDDAEYFARGYLDPIAVLPVNKDMVAANILSRVDEKVLLA